MAEDEGYGLEDEEEKEEEPEKKDIKTKFDIKMIINERNKIHHEINIRIPDYNERIGRLNLDLFGDPDNLDWESKIDILNDEMDTPMTKTHPIAHKTKAVITEVKELQREYKELHKFYSRYVKEMGDLLDNSINIYLEMEKSYKLQLASSEGLKKPKPEEGEMVVKKQVITVGLVKEFLEEHGGQKLLNSYNIAWDNGNFVIARSSKGTFVNKGRAFFLGYHPDPKQVARRLFDKYTQERPYDKSIIVANKKNIDTDNNKNNSEPNQTPS